MAIIWSNLSFIILIYLYFSSRNKIRKALIESGRDASIFRQYKDPIINLKYGIVAVMAGLGLLFGCFLETYMRIEEEVAYLAPMFIFIGVGLIAFYLYAQRRLDKERLETMV